MWSKFKFEDEQIYSAKAGYTRFWIQRYYAFWRISTRFEDTSEFDAEGLQKVKSLPENFEWQQMIAGKQSSLIIHPALPDKALIIKPEDNISLMPAMKLDLLIKIPLWIQIYSSSVKPENLIFEFPTIELSSTWFGDTDDGEMAYRLPRHILFDFKPEEIEKSEAICPVKIHNDSETLIRFQRISVPASQLTLFSNGKIFFTNEIRVIHNGDELASDLQIFGPSSNYVQGLKPISAARMKTNMNLLRKSFHLIKSFTNS
jgi:hypothetical protein